MKTLQFKLLLLSTLLINAPIYSQITGNTSVCSGQTETYSTGTIAASYQWNVTGAKATNPAGSSITIEWGTTGTGTINLSTRDQNGNSTGLNSLNVAVAGRPNPVILSGFSTTCFDSQESKDSCLAACQFQPTRYSSPLLTGATYTWELLGNGTFTAISSNEIEVVWQTLGQQYIKVTVDNGAGCSNTFKQCVNVIAPPTAIIGSAQSLYTSGQPIKVCKNSEFFLQDQSTGSSNRRWDFGDGNSSDEVNITHSYSQGGTYQVILTAENSCFCMDSDTITVIVDNSEGAKIECIGTVCAGDSVGYYADTDCREGGWRMIGVIPGSSGGTGVGFDNAIQNVRWNRHPGYIEYYSSDCPSGCSTGVIEKIPVMIDSIEISGASPACIGDVNTYSVEPIPGSDYFWIVPSTLGTVLEDNGSSITIKIKGDGTIGLNYFNSILGCSGTTGRSILAKERLNFAMPSEVCNSDSSAFIVDYPIDWTIVNSSGQAVFNQSNVTEVHINWSSFASGNYTMQLGKLNSYCNDLDLPFTILPAPIAPDSIYGAATVCGAFAYTYSVNPKSGQVVEWEVVGGTPEVASGNTVTVNWYNNSTYLLKAAYRDLNSPNCRSVFTTRTIQSVLGSTALQVIASDSACGGDTANVRLSFFADNLQWTVIPNDGASILTDRFKNEIKVQYDASKTQNIIIKADGNLCGNPFSFQRTIYVQSFPSPTINFSDPNPCPQSPVTFSSNAVNPTWLIDGITYTNANPTLTFDTAKTILAQVTANYVGPMGCQVQRKNIDQLIVKVAPKAIITAYDTNLNHCNDTLSPITLYASLQGSNFNSYTYLWSQLGTNASLTNATSYTTPAVNPHGDYIVKITAPNGCVSTSDPFSIDTCSFSDGCPKISSNPNVSVDIILDSTNCSNFFIGNVIVNGGWLIDIRLSNPNIPQHDEGAYNVGFNLAAGYHSLKFEGSIFDGTDTLCFLIIVEKEIEVDPDFSIIKQPCSSTGLVRYQFKNTSTYKNSSPIFNWNFGNNAIVVSNGFDPIVDFNVGTHNITLFASGTGCSITKQITVAVPTIANFISTAPACQQEPVDFINTSAGNIIEYQWNLGGISLFDENPTATFIESNNDISVNLNPTINLYVLGSDGCRDTANQIISIRGNQFDGNILSNLSTVFCQGDSIPLAYFPNNLPNNNTPIMYDWSNYATTPVIYPKQTGNYQLKMQDNVGCRFVSNQINIQVNINPNPTIVGKQTFCNDEKVKLSVLNHPSYNLVWSANGNPTGITGENFKMTLPDGANTVNINATSTFSGCSSNNAPFPVTVLSAIPKPTVTSTNPYPLCEGSPITLTASPSSANLFWNTGQASSSITQSLAGRYTVIQTDPSGCKSSNFIDINPLPDFSNFMTGCYCIPSQPPVNLIGTPNMSSYQWMKDGMNVSPPIGTMKDLTASEGMFELIAVSDSGCVDTTGSIDIKVGGCDPCNLTLSNLSLNCTNIIGDSVFYDFSVEADIDNDPAFYSLTANIRLGIQPTILKQLQPAQISGTRNVITGSFAILDSLDGGALCIVITATNPAVNCSAEICDSLQEFACDFTPNFNYEINPYTCEVGLTQSAIFGSCTSPDSVIYSWSVNQGRTVFTGTGANLTLDSLIAGTATVCLQMQVFSARDSSFCIKDTCLSIVVPDCNCNDNCQGVGLISANFERFIPNNDSCITEFKLVLSNSQNVPVYTNLLKSLSGNGTILSTVSTTAGNNQIAYLVQFYQDSSACTQQCFEMHLNEGGSNCCINFCVDLPKCECDLSLSNLQINCSTRSGSNGAWYDFSFDTDLNACNGFNYDLSQFNVILNGNPVQVVNMQPSAIQNGLQTVQGIVDLTGVPAGNPLCFEVTSSLGGVACNGVICEPLPTFKCNLKPNFTSSFDKEKCRLTLTNISTVNNCMKMNSSETIWQVFYNGNTYQKVGNEVTFSNMYNANVSVCMTVSAVDYSGKITCTKKLCQDVDLPQCECNDDCDALIANFFDFDGFIQREDSCIIRLVIEIEDQNGLPFDINTIVGLQGTVVGSQLLSSNNGIEQYVIDFYPNEDWQGRDACFEFYFQVEDGVTCCQTFCIELPPCEDGARVSYTNDNKETSSAVYRTIKKAENEKISNSNVFKVFPNPMKNNINIEWNEPLDEKVVIRLLDHNSKIIYEELREVRGSNIELNLHNFAGGVYVLEIKRKESTGRKKVVILK